MTLYHTTCKNKQKLQTYFVYLIDYYKHNLKNGLKYV